MRSFATTNISAFHHGLDREFRGGLWTCKGCSEWARLGNESLCKSCQATLESQREESMLRMWLAGNVVLSGGL